MSTGLPPAHWPELIEPHHQGNPYETAELLNTLRQEGILTPTSTGWRWDEPAVRSLLGHSEVAALPGGTVGGPARRPRARWSR